MFRYRLFQRKKKRGRKTITSPIWWVAIGREIEESTHTTDPVQAKEFAEVRAERHWRQRKLGDHTAVSFAETAERWLRSDAKAKETDRVFLKWLLPRIGHESLSSVAHEDALDQLRMDAEAEGKWGHSAVDRMMTTVSSVLNFPRKRKGLREGEHEGHVNVLPRISVPKYGEKLREPRYLTEAQYARLWAELPAHQQLYQRLGTATLLRMRSMTQLEWSRIDLKRKRAWIPGEQMKQEQTFNFELSDEACAILREIQDYQKGEYAAHVQSCERKGKPVTLVYPPEHVCTYRGRRVDDLTTPAFKSAAQRAGVPWATTHIMSRHTGASWGAQDGVSLEERMLLGGWKDERSARRYSHLERSQVRRAAATVGRRLHTAVRRRGQNAVTPDKVKSGSKSVTTRKSVA